jgi:hypothetical protein
MRIAAVATTLATKTAGAAGETRIGRAVGPE